MGTVPDDVTFSKEYCQSRYNLNYFKAFDHIVLYTIKIGSNAAYYLRMGTTDPSFSLELSVGNLNLTKNLSQERIV